VVPRAALLEDEDKPAVFVVRAGKAARATLALGYIEGGWAEVRSGLKQGDEVVVAGKSAVRDGSDVQVIGRDGKAVAAPPKPKAAGDATAGAGNEAKGGGR
jgi:membrane fusion protein (multidrug efflux system)